MPGPYYRMPSGKLPMIDGKPVFITEAQFLGCCCDECTCPCQPWPPAEFPCGGLLENYIVDFYLEFTEDPFDSVAEYRGTVMVSAFSLTSGSCAWRALGATTEIRFYGSEGWGEWEERNRDVTLQFLPGDCVYDLSISGVGDGRKQPGGGPTGNYEARFTPSIQYQFTTLSVS